MKQFKLIFQNIIVIFSLFTSYSYAWQLKPFESTYTASISGIPFEGEASYTLTKKGNIWYLDTVASMALVERRESTSFEINKNVIRPFTYEFHQVGLKPKDIVINFDWKKLFAKGYVKKEEIFFSLKYKMLDPLSSQMALQQDVANGKKQMSYPVIDENQIEMFDFKVIGEEWIDTAVGKINTVKIERIRGNNSKRKTYLWFAKDWNYTVIRLYQLEKNGKEYVISLAAGTVNGKAIKGK